jgi:hypothetical protein
MSVPVFLYGRFVFFMNRKLNGEHAAGYFTAAAVQKTGIPRHSLGIFSAEENKYMTNMTIENYDYKINMQWKLIKVLK